MAGGGPQPQEGTEEVATVVTGDGKGGVECYEVRTVLCCGGTGGHYVWVGGVSCVPMHWEDSGRIPPQGGQQVYREAPR